MIRPRYAIAPVTLLSLGGLLAACGTKTIDSKQVENQITTSQQAKAANLTITEAHCPSGQKAKKGTSFICTIKINGFQVSYKATIDSVSGSTAHITTEPTKPIINAKAVQDGIVQGAGAGWTADCGPAIQQVDLDFILTCHASNAGQTQDVQFKVTDASGTLEPVTPTGGGSSTTTIPADTTTTTP